MVRVFCLKMGPAKALTVLFVPNSLATKFDCLICAECARNQTIRLPRLRTYLTECVYQLLLESQLPHKLVNLLCKITIFFTITNARDQVTNPLCEREASRR